jgi:ATP/maltotriose-dependent transcriptional regulator MalT
VEELLSTGPPQVRDVLLDRSILDRVSAEAAIKPAGTKQAAGILSALTPANAFILPIGSG